MIRDISNAITSAILIMVLGWAYVTPNIYRTFTPGLFGLDEISPRIYTDAPDQAAVLIRMVHKSEENAARFFEKVSAQPIYIICTTPECDALFGELPFGLTMGFHRVLISYKGVTQPVFNHERIHVDLHELIGLTGLTKQKFPAWFDEGLSEYLSGPVRFGTRATAEHKRAVLGANGFRDWNKLVSDGRYNRHYGAARAIVDDVVKKIGRAGLREIVMTSQTQDEFLSRLPQSVLNPQ